MEFRIADTLTDSLTRLSADEQKAVKTTVFDLQVNPSNPGLQAHKLEGARDPRFWSVRVNRDIRLIIHRSEGSLLLCYADHHDDAYRWAERRKLETHPTTGAAQIVEIRERVQEILVPTYVPQPHPSPAAPGGPGGSVPRTPLFTHLSEEELLGYGVPPEWLPDVRQADEDSLLVLAEHLPAEAAEALLELATGGRPAATPQAPAGSDPFEHPDAQRRFRLMTDVEELERALDYPWEKWTIFLHPAQRGLVERDYAGPARVSGSAGTGKTVVALHRAVFLARHNPEARVLLATFSETLANALRVKLRRLIAGEPRLAERLEVHSVDAIARRLYERHFGAPRLISRQALRAFLLESAASAEAPPESGTESPRSREAGRAPSGRGAGEARLRFAPHFLLTEWEEVVDAWQLESWEDYRDVRRLGRKTRLPEARRALLWSIFEGARQRLRSEDLITPAGMLSRLAAELASRPRPPFDFTVLDEAQDVSIPQLRFLAALGAGRPNGLFFAGDLGQRIFQQPFSWKTLGVDIRGRSRTLHINYRTSHQIRSQADRLLGPSVSDVDGNTEERRGTISVFNGPPPEIRLLESPEAEIEAVGVWLRERTGEGVVPHEVGVFVRSTAQVDRARGAVEAAGLPYRVLEDGTEPASGFASVSTMHLAKGLEFRAVAVMACEDVVIPLMERIEGVTEDSDLEEVYNTERHLLYVACTRARDHLLVTSGGEASEFLDDLLT